MIAIIVALVACLLAGGSFFVPKDRVDIRLTLSGVAVALSVASFLLTT